MKSIKKDPADERGASFIYSLDLGWTPTGQIIYGRIVQRIR